MEANPGTWERARETDTTMQDGEKMEREEGGRRGEGWTEYKIGYLYRCHPTRKLNQKERNEEPGWTASSAKGGGGRGESERKAVRDDDCRGILSGVKMAL